eukprot:6013925-Pyramimonas_sp.AAC.1
MACHCVVKHCITKHSNAKHGIAQPCTTRHRSAWRGMAGMMWRVRCRSTRGQGLVPGMPAP